MSRRAFHVFAYRLPLRRPVRFGHGDPVEVREGYLLRLTDEDGLEGWGEVAPLPGFSRESPGQALSDTRVGAMIWKAGLPEATRHIRWPSSRAGLEQAWRHLACLRDGKPPFCMLRPDAPSRVPVAALLQGDTLEQIVQGLRAGVGGCRTVKIKVGGRPMEFDARLVHEIHEALGHDVRIRIDANRAWSLAEAVRFARLIEGVEIDYIEEPVSHPGALRAFHEGAGLPVALDESLHDLKPEQWTHLPGVAVVVLKPMLLGGFEVCGQLARTAAHAGIRAVVSSSFESGVGTLGLIALVAALQTSGDAAGLDPYRWLADDVLEVPPRFEAGEVDVSAITRLQLRLDRLQEVAYG